MDFVVFENEADLNYVTCKSFNFKFQYFSNENRNRVKNNLHVENITLVSGKLTENISGKFRYNIEHQLSSLTHHKILEQHTDTQYINQASFQLYSNFNYNCKVQRGDNWFK